MKMPKMEKGKTVENGKWHWRQKRRKLNSVLVKNAENYFFITFRAISLKGGCLNY